LPSNLSQLGIGRRANKKPRSIGGRGCRIGQRKRNYDSAVAAVQSFTSQRDQALSQIANAEAEVDRIQSIIDDLTLVSPSFSVSAFAVELGPHHGSRVRYSCSATNTI